jgi:hypothetical protein
VADQITQLGEALDDEFERRAERVIEAVDLGWPQWQVAEWAGISRARVHQILAEGYPLARR